MITFWLIGALMLVIALAFILPTLLQKVKPHEQPDKNVQEANVSVYRDQLAELEADLRNGIVSREQYEQDRNEIERRVLEDVKTAGDGSAKRKPPASSRGLVYAVAMGLPILSLALYLRIGNTSAFSVSPNDNSSVAGNPAGNSEFPPERIEANVASLAKRLEQNPNDAQGWIMLARSYGSLEKYNEASAAYAKATALKSDDAELWADYAFTFAMANGQQLQGQPVELVKKALKIDPANPKALELAGSAAFEAGNYKEAIDYWERLLVRVPPESEVAQALNERIERANTLSKAEAPK
jgi:cytochrome c-type biogenesis protein CcmH